LPGADLASLCVTGVAAEPGMVSRIPLGPLTTAEISTAKGFPASLWA
jgi:hypothetical protein